MPESFVKLPYLFESLEIKVPHKHFFQFTYHSITHKKEIHSLVNAPTLEHVKIFAAESKFPQAKDFVPFNGNLWKLTSYYFAFSYLLGPEGTAYKKQTYGGVPKPLARHICRLRSKLAKPIRCTAISSTTPSPLTLLNL